MNLQKDIIKKISISVIPFVFLLSIGLIAGDITLHQKVFKTFMISIFNISLIIIFFIYIFNEKRTFDKKPKNFLYFITYFLYILIQYIVTFFSKEICYDREYHFGNYILIIVFAALLFLYLENLEDFKIATIFVNIFILILFVWSLIELIKSGFNFGSYRPNFSFGNTTYFAAYYIALFPLSIASVIIWYDAKKKIYENWFSILNAVIVLLGALPLLLSQSRASLLGIYLAIFIVFIPGLFLMLPKIKLPVKIGMIVLLIFLFIALPIILLKYPPPFVNKLVPRLVATIANPEFFINDRMNGWSGGLGLFKDHPIFGAGLGSVYASSFKYMNNLFYIYSDSNSFKHAHGEYFEILGEAGLFGIIFFSILVLFILVNMFKNFTSDKYNVTYRVLSLSIAAGVFAVLINEIFSLTLRMSVSMTAYFSILGMGVFLISIREKALIKPIEEKKTVKLPEFLEKPLNTNQLYIVLAIFLLFTIIGFFLIMPVFRAEYNIRKSYDGKYQQEVNYYINKAVTIMPGNPYAWTQKYLFDFNVYQEFLKQGNYKSGSFFQEEENLFNEVVKDLNMLNSIIPGYQDVYSKYMQLYITRYDFLLRKYKALQNIEDLKKSVELLKLALENLDKSLKMNFLNEGNHLTRMLVLNLLNNKDQIKENIKDYLVARVYLDLCRGRHVVKERVKIEIKEGDSKVELIDKIYNVTIGENDINRLVEPVLLIKNINELKEFFDNEIKKIFNYDINKK
ncbi:MAG TPA: O-antigen ligase family protein [Spirochaetota bacterium]|nr:O-antigen ligase family protein [Spirochaetota bacterium]